MAIARRGAAPRRARERLPRAIARLVVALAVVMPPAARALDVVKARAPAAIADGVLQIGARSVHLPPGEWVLIERDEFVMSGGGIRYSVDAYRAWAMLLDQRRFRAMVRLEMPVSESVSVGNHQDSLCDAGAAVLVQDFSRSGRDCIALFGYHDIRRHLQSHAAAAANWTESHRIKELDAAAQVAYQRRQPNAYGRVDIYVPAGAFSGDDDARQWAVTLRAAFLPLFEGHVDSVTLPPLPAALPPDAAASAVEPAN